MTAYEMRISDWSSDVCSSDLARADRYFIDNGVIPCLHDQMLQPPQLMDARLTSDHGGDSIVRPHQQGFLDARPPYTSPAGYGRQHAPDDNKLKIVERPFNSIGDSIVVGKAPELRTIGNDDFRDTGVQELRTPPAIPQVVLAERFAPTAPIDPIPCHPHLHYTSPPLDEDPPRPPPN